MLSPVCRSYASAWVMSGALMIETNVRSWDKICDTSCFDLEPNIEGSQGVGLASGQLEC